MLLNPEPGERQALPEVLSDASIREWCGWLGVVETRLKQVVAVCAPAPAQWSAAEVAGSVQDCVALLDQLQGSLVSVLGQRQHLEQEVARSQNALAGVRAELLGTQAGERRARYLALHDSLTALPNRRHFRERLNRALAATAEPPHGLTLLYIDIDGFKAINDTYGHHAGDELLKIVSVRLARAVRKQDVVGRLGGDEFACLLDGLVSREQLARLAEKLFDAVSAPFRIDTLTLSVQPSIGIAVCPGDGATADLLLRNADIAMYRAKQRQTGHAFFDQCEEPGWSETLGLDLAAGP